MTHSETKIAILILSAGASNRMGSTTKQLLPWRDTTLLGNAIRSAKQASCNTVAIVLGSHANTIQKQVEDEKVQIVFNKNWKSGLGSSISCGISALEKNKMKYKAVLILLVDQPFIDTAYLNLLITNYLNSSNGIIATNYFDKAGVPAIFDKTYFSELKELNTDQGARDLLKKYAKEVILLDPEGKARDMDTLDDYYKALKYLK
ncbi:nucleotidyltransferase family protein [Eudoraea sp.]|uniref:nucleotidyltransferase family protein n=1 Tax=Eudoraea sp. TaxID=1979955 RepID=UPI003C72B529